MLEYMVDYAGSGTVLGPVADALHAGAGHVTHFMTIRQPLVLKYNCARSSSDDFLIYDTRIDRLSGLITIPRSTYGITYARMDCNARFELYKRFRN